MSYLSLISIRVEPTITIKPSVDAKTNILNPLDPLVLYYQPQKLVENPRSSSNLILRWVWLFSLVRFAANTSW